ncbi:MAG: 50S ribosomal protein L17 [Candidatus Marinimicrobia bacterium]|jgi:large subunit ribosomal protein L17|nr:50S ribosomal protein L17 [Candidatus Neomarinimicrobiota bacterium]MDP6456033.1 50S ribosomal protein L17 [Candidatus Neomarinimicrobiota bacterium]MDP6592632.1 50S ribosomal protein L17 [Candidatus Neomarinimicrobiota bacterium]MDP6836478.1 50S ribosomal protein L17 [Candidatus Neomarinimicrobiota bacterium]|tara:strand:- start:3027 stop:3491 length:465 start_codon:yes stop_codon:yes gene_type:complete
MRHQKRGRKLGRTASHRKATLSNLASSLIEHKRIKTTDAKAKETRKFIEPLITKAKRGTLHDRRQVLRHIHRPDIVKILFDEIAPKYTDRQGGYTRIVKLGFRDNDSASVSQLELVDYAEMMADSGDSTEKKKRKTKKMVKAVTKAETQTDNEE